MPPRRGGTGRRSRAGSAVPATGPRRRPTPDRTRGRRRRRGSRRWCARCVSSWTGPEGGGGTDRVRGCSHMQPRCASAEGRGCPSGNSVAPRSYGCTIMGERVPRSDGRLGSGPKSPRARDRVQAVLRPHEQIEGPRHGERPRSLQRAERVRPHARDGLPDPGDPRSPGRTHRGDHADHRCRGDADRRGDRSALRRRSSASALTLREAADRDGRGPLPGRLPLGRGRRRAGPPGASIGSRGSRHGPSGWG